MIIYVFYVDVENDFTFTVEYFCLVAVGNCNATGLFETLATQIKAVKDKRGKMWLWDKWVAFGTDGPTGMPSEENGVWGLVKAVKPQMFTQHCVGPGHTLALVIAWTTFRFARISMSFCVPWEDIARGLQNEGSTSSASPWTTTTRRPKLTSRVQRAGYRGTKRRIRRRQIRVRNAAALRQQGQQPDVPRAVWQADRLPIHGWALPRL